MISLLADSGSNAFGDMTYQIPVLREINQFFDWFGGLIWYAQVGVGLGILVGIWLLLKIIAAIFGTSDE